MVHMTKGDVTAAARQLAREEWDSLDQAVARGPVSYRLQRVWDRRTANVLRTRPGDVRKRAGRLALRRATEQRQEAGVALDVGSVRRRQQMLGTRPPDRPDHAEDIGDGRWVAVDPELAAVARQRTARIAELVASSTLSCLTVRRAKPGELPQDAQAEMRPGYSVRGRQAWAEVLLGDDLIRSVDHEMSHVAAFAVSLEVNRGDIRGVVADRLDPRRRDFDEVIASMAEQDPTSRPYREVYERAVRARVASTRAAVRRDRKRSRALAAARR